MLIKVKENLHGLFMHQSTPFKPLGTKHLGKKFFGTTLRPLRCFGEILTYNQTEKQSCKSGRAFRVWAEDLQNLELNIHS